MNYQIKLPPFPVRIGPDNVNDDYVLFRSVLSASTWSIRADMDPVNLIKYDLENHCPGFPVVLDRYLKTSPRRPASNRGVFYALARLDQSWRYVIYYNLELLEASINAAEVGRLHNS